MLSDVHVYKQSHGYHLKILWCSGIFREKCRDIPWSSGIFRDIPAYSVYSAIFRDIPLYSVIFRHSGFSQRPSRKPAQLDEAGILYRSRGRLHRRVNNVKGANHLWHVDTNQKLIRWHMVVFGAIDGFSRLPVALSCSNNNKATTLLQFFTGAACKQVWSFEQSPFG